jgi:hypothetical protein
MKTFISIYSILLLCCSCVSKSGEKNKELKMVKAQKFKMSAQLFIQSKDNEADDNVLRFQTKLFLSKEQFEQSKTLGQDLQYGVDSAFVLLIKTDTIWPSYVMPVANGQLLNPQFIVAFDRSKLSGSETVQFKAAIKSLVSHNDSGVFFNLTKINSQYK